MPVLWVYEVANTILHLKRRSRVSSGEMSRFLDDLRVLPIDVDSEGIERVVDSVLLLADRHRLSIYDASYLELAQRTGHPVATQDDDLEKAAYEEQAMLVSGS